MELEAIADIEVELQDDTDSPEALEIEIQEAGPKGEPGLNAYEVYRQGGGELTEEEWLASLKGDPGYTPVRGTDYWTEEDKDEIKSYCDSLVIDVLGGSF